MMAQLSVLGRVQAEVDACNEKSSVLAAELPFLLIEIEKIFGFKFPAEFYKMIKLFAIKHNVRIDKEEVIDFISDLLETDFIAFITKNSELKRLEDDIEVDKLIKEEEIKQENEELDEKADYFSNKIESLSNEINDIDKDINESKMHDQKPSLREVVNTNNENYYNNNKIILIVNIILIIILLMVIIVKSRLFKVFIESFLRNCTNDLCWWQKIPIIERIIWNLFDYVEN